MDIARAASILSLLAVSLGAQETSTVHGRVLGLPDGQRFRGVIEISGKRSRAARPRLVALLHPGGRFTIPDCPPGKYTVTFRLRPQGKPFRVVNEVVVRAGRPCRDPRLGAIDVSKHARVVRVTVLDASGKPSPGAFVGTCILHAYSKSWVGGTSAPVNEKGVANLVLPVAGAHVWVRARGYQNARLPMLKSDAVVRLQKSHRITLDVGGMPALPRNLYYAVQVKRRRDQIRWQDDWGWILLDNNRLRLEKGEATLHYQDPGAYDVTLVPMTPPAKGGLFGRKIGKVIKLRFRIKKRGGPTRDVHPRVEVQLSESQSSRVREHIQRVRGRRDR